MDPWALQSHSINASLDQLFKPLSLHVMCLVKGETDASFPRGEKKSNWKKEMADVVNEIAFVSIFLLCFLLQPSVNYRTFPFGILDHRSPH